MKSKNILTAALIIVTAGTFSFSTFSGGEPWVVPPKYVSMANPVKSDAKATATGKKLYIKNCEDCHGKKGIGDGSKASDLKVAPKDLSATATQSQPDGSLFYKISEGRGEMPKFKKDITDPEDIWSIVNYIRTLKK